MPRALDDPRTREALDTLRRRTRRTRRAVVAGAGLLLLAVSAVVVALLLAAGDRPGVPVAGSVALLSGVVGAAVVIAGLLQARTTDRWVAALTAAPWWAGTLRRTAPVAFAVQVTGGPLLDLRLRMKPVLAARTLDRVRPGPAGVVRLPRQGDWLVAVQTERGPELLEAWVAPSWSPFAPPPPPHP